MREFHAVVGDFATLKSVTNALGDLIMLWITIFFI